MNREHLLERLRALKVNDDTELAHENADDLLLSFIDDEEISEAFYAIERWYA